MLKIKKGDTVQVITGKDSGKKGKVLKIFPPSNRILVEGINTAKKHMRQRRQDQKAGIVTIEMPLDISNVQLLCKYCSRPVRVGFKVLSDKTKTRFCKSCKESL